MVRYVEPKINDEWRKHLSRIGKLARGKAKRRSKEQYSKMGKRRWEKYWEEKRLLAKTLMTGT